MENALILINLGAPKNASVPAARSFLREFLSDKEVISVNYFLRKFIAFVAAKKRGEAYAKMLEKICDGGVHPLRKYTENLAKKVSVLLADTDVLTAYRYGENSISSSINAARSAGAKNFYFIALYPQNAASTTLSAKKEVFKNKKSSENFVFLDSYHSNSTYINALAETLKPHLKGADAVLAPFHSVPLCHLKKTPYLNECQTTVELLKKACEFENIKICWQSKMGRGEWLEPSAKSVCADLANSGAKNVVAICAGFSADCSETLLEIGEDLREDFFALGGKTFRCVPCLNDSDAHADLIYKLYKTMR